MCYLLCHEYHLIIFYAIIIMEYLKTKILIWKNKNNNKIKNKNENKNKNKNENENENENENKNDNEFTTTIENR